MKRIFTIFLITSIFFAILPFHLFKNGQKRRSITIQEPGPKSWFLSQRIYPQGKINYEVYEQAISEIMEERQTQKIASGVPVWQFAGPDNLGGRVSDVEMHSSSQERIYVGAASGGVFKSTDAGNTFVPIFDQQPSLSIGDIAIAPSDANILYVGTGEANGGGGSVTYDGAGVFKSTDAGSTWTSVGLSLTRNVGRIAIDPTDPTRVFVAAMGDLFGKGPDRGIYRTTNGGTTWQKVLFVNDSTGGIDIVINPQKPDTIFATTWERTRTPDNENYGGSSSNIYRSVDGGTTWTILTSGLPDSSPNIGRIGIDLCASSPNVLYAIHADEIGYLDGIYKSTNNGNTWAQINNPSGGSFYSSYGWWFGRIRVDPTNSSVVYTGGLSVYKSTNGGSSWSTIDNTHVDNHGVYVHPQNPNLVLCANDGGLDISTNGGTSCTKADGLPIMQFYSSEINFLNTSKLYGGSQDNGTNRTLGTVDNWYQIGGGDGFQVMVDPTNTTYVYTLSQYGDLNTSMSGISGSDRKNWSTPLAMNPLNPKSIYYGSYRLYKSMNRSSSWSAISTDLTKGTTNGNLIYGTLTTISVSEADTNVIYVGADDGNVKVTTNNGGTWTTITSGLPNRWITRVAADPLNAGTAYVTLSGYRDNEYLPHVFRTTNFGSTWQSISSNLPQIPVNDIIIDPSNTSTLYVATDAGVYYTTNLGGTWQVLGTGLPLVVVTDITLHDPTRLLVAATYGRSMYKADLTTLTTSTPEVAQNNINVNLFPNPAKGFFHVEISQEIKNGEITLYDLKGEKVFSSSINNGSNKIQPREISSGVYLYKIVSEGSMIKGGKIVFSAL